ncbi:MAG: N-formylglutamate amidohydrolase [Desulfobulbaceae bacterium]|nr:N-formylglutamate amidohydrolase [Desulfobulbaceae bacterium]
MLTKIVNQYYQPYHRELSDCVGELIPWYRPIIIDCHSFSEKTVTIVGENRDLPDFCLGTDVFHTPVKIVNDITAMLNSRGEFKGLCCWCE